MLKKLSVPRVYVCVCVAFVPQLRQQAQAAVSPIRKGKLLPAQVPKVNSVICLLYAATLPSYDCMRECVCVSVC